ncbi:MAG TPA: hypothetical protein ENK44_12240 [Caldithrix abyssi]|uniref:Uncharacterized protein n=1 Tax=Caldithrix abyssi TaxID=187145 RepID=A0A7V4U1T7_CALAY|nr:hypothetical protein [Caldithrix abyssi]
MKNYNFIIGLIFLVVLVGCQINEPKLPPWESEWTLYLPTQDFYMSEAVDEENGLLPDTTGDGIPILAFNLQDSTDWEQIDARDLSIKPDDKHFSGTLDEIQLDKPVDVNSDRIYFLPLLNEVFPGVGVGDTLPPYDSITVQPPSQTVAFTDFKYVKIKEGSFYITFYNDLFVGIRSGMKIDVYDDSLNTFITTFEFTSPIPPKSSLQSDPVTMDGKSISNKLRFQYTLPLEGSSSPQVITQEMANGSIYTVFSMTKLKVEEAWAIIPDQSFSRNDSVDISDQDYRIRRAVIKKSGARISITNQLPVNASIRVEFPNFIRDGQIKVIEPHISAGSFYSDYIDFSGYELINANNPGEFIQYVHFNASANITTDPGFVRITAQDSFVVDVKMDSLMLSELDGQIDTLEFDFDEVRLDSIDIFKDIEGRIRLEDLILTLNFDNQINFPIGVQLEMIGYHKDDENGPVTDSVKVIIDELVQKSDDAPVTTIVLDKNSTNPSIIDLMAIMPTEISIKGKATVGGDGSVTDGDGIRLRYSIDSPLAFHITEPLVFQSSMDSLHRDDISDDTRKKIDEQLLMANVALTLTNQMPIGADVFFVLSVDSTDMDSSQAEQPWQKLVIKANVEPAVVDASGYVSQGVDSQVEVNLTKEQIQIFNYSPLYYRQTVTINETNQTVRIRQQDGIVINGFVKMRVMLNKEE